MERQVAHMVRLVDDLLELSRISRGQIELKKERVELATIIDHAVEASRPFIESHGHHLTVSLPTEPIVVDGDLVRLSQVFANLLNNAAKYTQNGGRITLSARREGANVVASIRDTGIGIPSDMLSRVFDMFTQVDNVLRRSQDGLGIGLSLVRSLVAMHGGSVEARSGGLGQGSEFIVRLPLAEHQNLGTTCSSTIGRKGDRSAARVESSSLMTTEDAADSLSMVLSSAGRGREDRLRRAIGPGSAAHLPSLGRPPRPRHARPRRLRSGSTSASRPRFRDLTLIALTGWGQEENRHRTRGGGLRSSSRQAGRFRSPQALLASLESQTPIGGASPARAK